MIDDVDQVIALRQGLYLRYVGVVEFDEIGEVVAVEFFMILGKDYQSYLLGIRSKRRLFDLFLSLGIFRLFLSLLDGVVPHGLCGLLD